MGIGAPLPAAVVWGTLIAPAAPVTLATPLRVALELVILGLGAAALHAAGRPRLAKVFAGLVIVNEVLLLVWDQ